VRENLCSFGEPVLAPQARLMLATLLVGGGGDDRGDL
jgi:hypothetical protein